VTGEDPLTGALKVITQPIGPGPALDVSHDHRPAHLVHGVGREDLVDRVRDESGIAGQVGNSAPQSANWGCRLEVELRLERRDSCVGIDLVTQRPTRVIRGQSSVLHLQGRENALSDDISPGPIVELLHDLSEQPEREVGVVEGKVDGKNLLGVLELAQQALPVRRVEVLPDPTHRLPL